MKKAILGHLVTGLPVEVEVHHTATYICVDRAARAVPAWPTGCFLCGGFRQKAVLRLNFSYRLAGYPYCGHRLHADCEDLVCFVGVVCGGLFSSTRVLQGEAHALGRA